MYNKMFASLLLLLPLLAAGRLRMPRATTTRVHVDTDPNLACRDGFLCDFNPLIDCNEIGTGPPPPCEPIETQRDQGLCAFYDEWVIRNSNPSLGSWDGDPRNACGEWKGISCISNGDVQVLDIDRFGVKGTIPTEIGFLTSELIWVFFASNMLTGSIPTEIAFGCNASDSYYSKCTLSRVDLQNNMLTGTIPTELGAVGFMLRLELNNNMLTGPIPSEFGNYEKVDKFNLYNNQLSGSIPPELDLMRFDGNDYYYYDPSRTRCDIGGRVTVEGKGNIYTCPITTDPDRACTKGRFAAAPICCPSDEPVCDYI